MKEKVHIEQHALATAEVATHYLCADHFDRKLIMTLSVAEQQQTLDLACCQKELSTY